MKPKLLAWILIGLSTTCPLRADPLTESVQQKLKEQGFYYGEISGTRNAETIAALRRYQIRNGLKISGELDAETQRSLGIASSSPPKAPAKPIPTPMPAVSISPPRNTPQPVAPRPETSGIFDGTPFEVAPPEVQRRVIVGAQTMLARRGYYRSAIDGAYGPGMQFALQAFQSRFGLISSGLLDMDTLAALGLLPGQRAPGVEPPRRRSFFRPRSEIGPTGERIYIPN